MVTAPKSASSKRIDEFVLSKADWILNKVEYFKKHPSILLPKNTKAEYLKNKTVAQALAESRVAHFNIFYKFKYNTISIKNQKTRWGSCSKKGNLNFNYRIALVPIPLADYVVVHELCHLKQMNHSKKFWDLVSQTIPDWRVRRRELHKHRFL